MKGREMTARVRSEEAAGESLAAPRTVQFFVPGEPRGKGRPRATARGGFVRMYTDSATVQYEGLVREAAHDAWSGPPTASAVSVNVEVRLSVPKRTTKKLLALMLCGKVHPTKADIDNYVKAAFDGMNGVTFCDDRQIVAMTARKFYSEAPGLDITVSEIGA